MPPPAGHPNGRRCPQCDGDTWQMTRCCVHCGADLFALDHADRQRRLAMRKAAIAGGAVVISGVAWWLHKYLPADWKVWVIGLGLFSLFVAAEAVKD